MLSKAQTLIWYARHPAFWAQAVALARCAATNDGGHAGERPAATAWAAERSLPTRDILLAIGLLDGAAEWPRLSQTEIDEATARGARSAVEMGGPGDLELLHAAIALARPERVVETGVAYGWSSWAILRGLLVAGRGRLVSVDMPYAKRNNEAFVGIVVPPDLAADWTLIREPDRNGLRKALRQLGGAIDLCHYDSDKSYQGRMFAYPLLWQALRPGGIFISDDIQDNLAFRDFFAAAGVPVHVTSSDGKFVGVARKPEPAGAGLR